jgi:hypothetical protein
MVLLFSLLIVAVSSFAALLLLTWCVQYATGWLLPTRRDEITPLSPHNVKPIHARG